MKTIYLSNSDIISVVNFAIYTVDKHYQRMWKDKSKGISKIIIGKLGEIAISKYLSMVNIRSEVNMAINAGVDKGDLSIFSNNFAIKTKSFKNSLPTSLRDIYLHIPKDQYKSLFAHKIKGIIAVCLHQQELREAIWVEMPSVKLSIIGGITLEDYDKNKTLHIAGNEIAPDFVLPPPDSYGVSWELLEDIDCFIENLLESSIMNVVEKEYCDYSRLATLLGCGYTTIEKVCKKMLSKGLVKKIYDRIERPLK